MRAVALPLAVAFALAWTPPSGRADDAIRVKLVAGPELSPEMIAGEVAVRSFTVRGKHGTMEIPAASVTEIRKSSRPAAKAEGPILLVSTADEQTFEGVIVEPKALEIRGRYGRYATTWGDIQGLQVEPRPGPPPPSVLVARVARIEAEGGGRLSGALWAFGEVPGRPIQVEIEFGSVSVAAEKVRTIRFVEPGPPTLMTGGEVQRSGSVETTDGVHLSGRVTIPSGWSVDSKLGVVGLKYDQLKTITFVDVAGPPAPAARPAEPDEADEP